MSVASFDGASFDELGSDSVYNIWSKSGIAIVKKIPGGSKNVIQKIGVDLPRLAMPIKATASQITALYGKVGNSGTLIFSYETCTARLESMDAPQSIGIGNDLYTSTLNLIRTASVSTIPANARLTESGNVRLTESGNIRIIE